MCDGVNGERQLNGHYRRTHLMIIPTMHACTIDKYTVYTASDHTQLACICMCMCCFSESEATLVYLVQLELSPICRTFTTQE